MTLSGVSGGKETDVQSLHNCTVFAQTDNVISNFPKCPVHLANFVMKMRLYLRHFWPPRPNTQTFGPAKNTKSTFKHSEAVISFVKKCQNLLTDWHLELFGRHQLKKQARKSSEDAQAAGYAWFEKLWAR